MAIVIKEIEVKTKVEKRIIDKEQISVLLYNRLKEEILQELNERQQDESLGEYRRNER